MQGNALGKYTWSFGVSVILTSIFSALLVVAKESNPDILKAWMKSMGHHWVIHGIFNLIVFFVLGFVLANMSKTGDKHDAKALASRMVLAIAGCTLVIAGFYLLEG